MLLIIIIEASLALPTLYYDLMIKSPQLDHGLWTPPVLLTTSWCSYIVPILKMMTQKLRAIPEAELWRVRGWRSSRLAGVFHPSRSVTTPAAPDASDSVAI